MIDEAKISEICTNLDSKLLSIAQQSQQEHAASLAAGEQVPKFGRYQPVGETAQQMASSAKREAIGAIQQILEADARSMRQQRTQRVNANDLATVQTALSRDNITDNEIMELYDEFSGNYQLAQLIAERGHKKGLMFGVRAQPAADLDAAMTKARSSIGVVGEYGHDMFLPSVVSDSIAQAYNHTDIFGRRYD